MRFEGAVCAALLLRSINHTTIKITSEFRNVGDAAVSGDAYAMSHLSAETCTQRLAAGRGDGYRLAAASSVACSYRTAEHWTTGLAVKSLVSNE